MANKPIDSSNILLIHYNLMSLCLVHCKRYEHSLKLLLALNQEKGQML